MSMDLTEHRFSAMRRTGRPPAALVSTPAFIASLTGFAALHGVRVQMVQFLLRRIGRDVDRLAAYRLQVVHV